MKTFIFLSICVTLALGCSDPLPELGACNTEPEGDCSCESGLSCELTKKFIYKERTTLVKQCMPEGVDIEVETVDLDNQVADAPMRSKRFLFGSALFRAIHQCGCAEGLICTETIAVNIPFTGIRLPLMQCM
ncbi:hypothetical protein OS493_037905 [Desmophyllum pertusum]|uniref:Uncharacterized protein n=1 Tax=Desmophyllum pertusum TaxID=174260 RepID=A0A9X0CTY1_9CNID|nr:hypothetical protein OS493_037905 [Desmophyllum pertusum]